MNEDKSLNILKEKDFVKAKLNFQHIFIQPTMIKTQKFLEILKRLKYFQ